MIAPTYDSLFVWLKTISAVYQEQLFRDADDSGRANLLMVAFGGGTVETFRKIIQASDEWIQKHSHVDPSGIPLEKLAAIRGALWTVKGNYPKGPRPGQDSNIFAIDYIDQYEPADQKRGIQAYKDRGYTHAPHGPIVDAGYHGQFDPEDWRGSFDKYLDNSQLLWDGGITPVEFIHPDGWTLDQLRGLESLFRQERCQKLFRVVVVTGWEPTKYGWTNAQWVDFLKWGADVFPNALRLIHTVSDVDAPTGGDDDKNLPGGNATAWQRVAPFIHGWLVQNSAFETPDAVAPNGKTNHVNFIEQFSDGVSGSLAQRFHKGYAGWPTTSAWGNQPLKIYAGEYASYWVYWNNRPEDEARQWGAEAIKAGADGALDGVA